ncbi:UbiA prenyltransferase family-domain-containing protein [Mycena maculata]|uniref:UbiA prenyltransferase family-domain-containing protein n=1 Tax=Mycena maculata TaxID=230809 RepID=A0AAD7J469_9AGAR|nr:UbiA prenyltransferase family-domain-containing protein [Mycena maculata]
MSFSKSLYNFIQQTSETVKASIHRAGSTFITLFLFTKSDIKTTLLPIASGILRSAIGGMVAAPIWSFGNFVEEFLWIWLHLLQFTTSNQSCSLTAVSEDTDNKPDRPIPAGRMTLRQVRILRWSLVPVCLAVSYQFSTSVLASSVAVIAITTWYNEFGGGGNHWFIRNLLNGLGFGAFQAGRDRTEFDIVAARAILLSIGIYATTTHTQDFKDIEGDSKFNRSTVPLAHPRVARPSVLVGLMAWSSFLPYVWELNAVTTMAMFILAAFVGVRFCTKDGRRNDQISFYWYNVSS